ncbi:pyridine nucleotide-disulfide oxidoreductase [Caulobacter sp. 602-2]|uniref:Pyridine nucleotide-disulfide oxidoreductase n=1 Tax=Caulobacter sp. 602-2 TaxID=2710887 RepID=A0A6G4QTF9_9CAUL|nr:FAD/NAD(P)-binding protein [Caulobacter sp. 602-2]NGM48773.1 pyridine nucleotide-disulfide oxidoreductase [Caulobacter sp. 602-2]
MALPPTPVIAVVGAGFSGVMTALNLLRDGAAVRVILLERNAPVGLGAAYATHNPSHRLNVRAGNMSAWPDRPGDFVDWMQGLGLDVGAGDFATRGDYGRYLQALLAQIVEGPQGAGRLVIAPDAVVGLEPGGDGWRLTTAMGRPILADAVVLALGNPPPCRPHGVTEALAASPAYVADPWRWDPARLPPGPVLLLGTGLTMVDLALSLEDMAPGRSIIALSRRGLTPREHEGEPPARPPSPPASDIPPLVALAWLRRTAAEHGWRTAVDALRPATQDLWRGWSVAHKQAFLRHARPFWDVHRHRLSPEVAARVAGLRRTGRLKVAAGKIVRLAEAEDGRVEGAWRPRGETASQPFSVSAVVNATGPTGDVTRSTDPLLLDLIRRGLARPDPLRLGLDVDADNRLLDVSGSASRTLLAVGPVTRGARWEINAVPDIRGQAAQVAAAALAAVRRG